MSTIGSKSLYILLSERIVSSGVRRKYWEKNTVSFILRDFLRSSVSKEHSYPCLTNSASHRAGHQGCTQPLLILKKFTREQNNVGAKAQLQASYVVVVLSYVTSGVMSWTYESPLGRFPFLFQPLPKRWRQHFTGACSPKKETSQATESNETFGYRSQIHSLVQGLLLPQIMFDDEEKFETRIYLWT